MANSFRPLQVHSLFSMLDMKHAYVTVLGRLIGVVALKEVRECSRVHQMIFLTGLSKINFSCVQPFF